MKLQRRSFLQLAGTAGTAAASAALGIAAPAIVRAGTAVKLTLPWLPLGTYSYTFVTKKMGFWEKRGLDVTIDRGFGSGRVCVPVDQGQYDFGLIDLAVMMNCAARGLDLTAVAGVWPRSPVGIFSLKEYGITKPRDLEGRRCRRVAARVVDRCRSPSGRGGAPRAGGRPGAALRDDGPRDRVRRVAAGRLDAHRAARSPRGRDVSR